MFMLLTSNYFMDPPLSVQTKCQTFFHVLTSSAILMAMKRRKLSGSQWSDLWTIITYRILTHETSQLPSSTKPVICPTVNQTAK